MREMLTKHWEIIKAFKEGKTIQYFNELGEWRDDENPSFGCNYNFRIKPESQLVPFSFEDAEFLLGKKVKAKTNDIMAGLILSISDIGVHIHPNTNRTFFDSLLYNYTFLDGSPCGKLVEV